MDNLEQLVERAQAGSLIDYGEIARRFQDMACGYAYSLLGDRHLAEDAAQEAFVEAYRVLHQLKRPAAFPGWFRRVVHTQCYRQTRSKPLPVAPVDAAQDVRSADPTPEEAAHARELADSVLAAVRELPEHEREATTLFYMSGRSQREIAAFLDVPVSTVKNRLYSARRRLKRRMTAMLDGAVRSITPDREFWRRVVTEATDAHLPYLCEMSELYCELFGAGPDVEVTAGGDVKRSDAPFDADAWRKHFIEDRDELGRPKQGQIFLALQEGALAGMVQTLYGRWQDGLVAWIDWIGVCRAFRRRGLGSELLHRAIAAAHVVASQYELSALGVVSMTTPCDPAATAMWQAVGAQIRGDLGYQVLDDDPPEHIVWLPFDDKLADIDTRTLAWLLWRFPGLPSEAFVKRYGRDRIVGDCALL